MHWGRRPQQGSRPLDTLPRWLGPSTGGPDKNGCFFRLRLWYPDIGLHGLRPEVQCLATGDDQMITWKKFGGNPVISSPPAGIVAPPGSYYLEGA